MHCHWNPDLKSVPVWCGLQKSSYRWIRGILLRGDPCPAGQGVRGGCGASFRKGRPPEFPYCDYAGGLLPGCHSYGRKGILGIRRCPSCSFFFRRGGHGDRSRRRKSGSLRLYQTRKVPQPGPRRHGRGSPGRGTAVHAEGIQYNPPLPGREGISLTYPATGCLALFNKWVDTILENLNEGGRICGEKG